MDKKLKKFVGYLTLVPLFGIILGITSFAAWLTHLYVCFSDDRWGFLIAGAIMFPIAIIHGIGVWFGVW